MSLAVFARRIGESHGSLRDKARAGAIPAVKIANKWLVPTSYLDDLEAAAYRNVVGKAAS